MNSCNQILNSDIEMFLKHAFIRSFIVWVFEFREFIIIDSNNNNNEMAEIDSIMIRYKTFDCQRYDQIH